jgi:hypothetical protein
MASGITKMSEKIMAASEDLRDIQVDVGVLKTQISTNLELRIASQLTD